jgi:hypothetical protein
MSEQGFLRLGRALLVPRRLSPKRSRADSNSISIAREVHCAKILHDVTVLTYETDDGNNIIGLLHSTAQHLTENFGGGPAGFVYSGGTGLQYVVCKSQG